MLPTSATAPELLSPAGDWEALRAAVANGADAVYLGLSNFSARHRAANFTLAELPQVMEHLHAHNVRGYVALNTLIFSDELAEVADLARGVAAAGADAVIVQDLGLTALLHRMLPGLPLHGSTQMTLTESLGIEWVRKLGIERVILARELSMRDVEKIHSATDMPLEVFVHGALCIAYSGQCLTSESLGGRSANRGQCAQACRLPYDLVVDGKRRDLGEQAYLLSPQDLSAHERIGDLVNLGVGGFKIEGRLKSAHYVAAATQSYRAAIDAAIAQRPFSLSPQQAGDLAQSFSRGFTHGFLDGVNHQELVHGRFPKNRGVRVGTVAAKTREGLVVSRERGCPQPLLKPGDGVVFDEGHPEQDEQGGRVFSVRDTKAAGDGRAGGIEITLGRGDVNLAAVAIGSIVWKTDDPAVRRRLEHSWSRDIVQKRVPLSVRASGAIGGMLRITVADDAGHEAAVSWDQPLARAEKFPLNDSLLREQFTRLGNTPFELRDVTLDCPDPVMVPKSVLNDLRRRAVEALVKQREAARQIGVADPDALAHLRAELPESAIPNPQSAILTLLVRTLDQLAPALAARPAMLYCEFEDIRRYKDAIAQCRSAGVPVGLATTRIIKPGDEGLLRQLADCAPDAVLVRNLAGIAWFSQHAPAMPLIGDYSLNVANELTAGLLLKQGLVRLVPSYDLNWEQLAAMLGRIPPAFFEAVLHQHMPMFHMEHCVFAHMLSNGKDYRDCGRPCDRHRVDLHDRVGVDHPLVADVGCRNTVYNGTAQSAADFVPQMKRLGIGYYRVELLREDAPAAAALIERYTHLLSGQEDGPTARRKLRVLNQLGVTPGTLEFA